MDDARYYTQLAAAFVRGTLPDLLESPLEKTIQDGIDAGLRLHKFKRNVELPRVRRVLGMLQGLVPGSLLDIGSGRGTFLWPLLDLFPGLETTSVETNPIRARDMDAVRRGGVANLSVVSSSAESLGLAGKSFDIVTILEVLEHLEGPRRAVAEALRVGRRAVLASVPSKEDENPEHLRLFDKASIEEIFTSAGARRVSVEYVPGHIIALAMV
jgi:ubiquinone/menaquinone biosynthesis C-methylase UbiE